MNTKVSVKEKICYGIGSGGGNIITQILGTFLTAYYTDSVGIAAAAVGTMMLVARLLDGISDVMMVESLIRQEQNGEKQDRGS